MGIELEISSLLQ